MNNMTVARRLALSFSVLLALLIGISILAVFRLAELNDALDTVVNNRGPKVEVMNDMAYRSMDNARMVRNIIMLTDQKYMLPERDAIEANIAANAKHVAYLKEHLTTKEDQKLLQDMSEARLVYAAFTEDVVALGLAKKDDEATALLQGPRYASQAAYFASILKLIDWSMRPA